MVDIDAIVLAAGHGKRMKSSLPKVMHAVAGRPLVYYPISAALAAGARRAVVVVGHEREQVTPFLDRTFGDCVCHVIQHEQNGTGHAAAQALPVVPDSVERVLILCGDTPLLCAEDLRAIVRALDQHPEAPLAMLTCIVDDPTGYGRIVRDECGRIREIREHRDLENDAQRAICEVNPGVYCARTGFLRDALTKLDANNAQGEIYLTDIVSLAATRGGTVDVNANAASLVGVNDRVQLAAAETVMQGRIIERVRRAGVTVCDGVVLHDTVDVSVDAVIENGATLRGSTTVASGAVVGVGCVLDNANVGENARLLPYTVVTDATIADGVTVGPFAWVRS